MTAPGGDIAAIARHASEARVQQILTELVRVPSPLTDLREREPLLRAFIDTAVAPRLGPLGAARLRRDPMGNLLAEFGAGPGRHLLLVTNAMNQPQADMDNAYAGDVRDGAAFGIDGPVVLGKGASEQKAVLAAVLHAFEVVAAMGRSVAGRVSLLCCVSGESGSHEAIACAMAHFGLSADMALIGGADMKLSLGNRGRADIAVTVTGAPCHSSRPERGANAITGAQAVLAALAAGHAPPPPHPQLGPATLTVTGLRSGPVSSHTVQDRVEITLDRRLLPGETPEAAFAAVAALLAPLDGMPDPVSGLPLGVTAELGPAMHPSLIAADSALARTLARSFRDTLGRPVEMIHATNAFDQGYLNLHGIPAATWGPGESRFAHTASDLASVRTVTAAARVYADLMLRDGAEV